MQEIVSQNSRYPKTDLNSDKRLEGNKTIIYIKKGLRDSNGLVHLELSKTTLRKFTPRDQWSHVMMHEN